jgi:hypothetical protein
MNILFYSCIIPPLLQKSGLLKQPVAFNSNVIIFHPFFKLVKISFFCLTSLSEIGKALLLNFRLASIADSKTTMTMLAFILAASIIARPGPGRRFKEQINIQLPKNKGRVRNDPSFSVSVSQKDGYSQRKIETMDRLLIFKQADQNSSFLLTLKLRPCSNTSPTRR